MRDVSGIAQVTLKKGAVDAAFFPLFTDLPRESVVEVEGKVQKSPKAALGVELLPSAIRVASRAGVPLPLGVVDKVGAELDTRLNHRVLDLRKPALHQLFDLRAALLEGFRDAFREQGFLEVETPKLLRQGAEGGATLFAVDYFGTRAFLAQSPQLYKQMLMSAGFERVFEIAPAFRAEPSDTVRHITEFTSLDAEMSFIEGPEDLRASLEKLLDRAFRATAKRLRSSGNPLAKNIPSIRPPLPRIPFRECAKRLGRAGRDKDLSTEEEKQLGEILVPEFGSPLYFITDFPTEAKAGTFYAKRSDADPTLTEYFDLGFRGLEVVSGGPREHRLESLKANFHAAGLDLSTFSSYLEAFEFGMPPHGGWALGIDRLMMALAGVPNIRETRLFPRDRYRLDP